jgi:hypothetical protein
MESIFFDGQNWFLTSSLVPLVSMCLPFDCGAIAILAIDSCYGRFDTLLEFVAISVVHRFERGKVSERGVRRKKEADVFGVIAIMERDTQQNHAAHQPLNIPQRKGSKIWLCDSSSNHQSVVSNASAIGLDIDSNFDDSHTELDIDIDLELPPQQTFEGEAPQPQESIMESDEEFAEPDDDDDEPCASEQSSDQEEEESRPSKMPQNDSSPSFDAMLQRFDMGTCIVDLKAQRDCLNSPMKDGSNATGDDPPTYPTHLTTRYEDDQDEEDTTYRDEDEEVPLRSSPSSRDRQRRPGCNTTRPPSISNSVGSNISSPEPYYAKVANIRVGGSTGLSASYRTGEDGSTALESESTSFLLTEGRVRAFMVDYYDDMDSIGQSKECLETFFRHYCIPDIRWMRPDGNPVALDGLIHLFTEELKVEKIWLVSVDSIQILAGGLAAVVTVTADQTFVYRGVPDGDRAVISSVLEVVNHGREIKIVHEHRTSGTPIPKETRWSTTES